MISILSFGAPTAQESEEWQRIVVGGLGPFKRKRVGAPNLAAAIEPLARIGYHFKFCQGRGTHVDMIGLRT